MAGKRGKRNTLKKKQNKSSCGRKNKEENEIEFHKLYESDENFAMIMGYTSGGFAYGITHEEMRAIINEELREDEFEKSADGY